jgi:hypothetical protein
MHFESSQHPKTFSEGEGLRALSFGESLGEASHFVSLLAISISYLRQYAPSPAFY